MSLNDPTEPSLSGPTRVATEVTLRNGVWVHETEWHALGALIRAVHDILPSLKRADTGITGQGVAGLSEAYWNWRHAEMDIEDETRAIRSLTQIVGELSTEGDDVTIDSVL